MNFFVPQTFRTFLRGSFFTSRQVIERGNQALQLQQILIVGAQLLLQGLRLVTENARIFARIDRKAMLKINNAEFALL